MGKENKNKIKTEKSIVVYANYAASYEGNFFASQKALAKKLSNYNIKTLYVLPENAEQYDWPHSLVSNNIEVYYQPKSIGKRILFLRNLLKSREVLFIHTHFIPFSQILEAKISIFLSQKRHVQIVEHFHNHYSLNNKIIEFIKRFIKKNDYFIGCSKDVYEDFSIFNLKNRCSYVENAIDFSRLDISKDYSVERKSFNIMIFGFDYFRKGVDLALDAIEKVINDKKKICFYIVLSTNKFEVTNKIIERFGMIPEWVKILPARNDIATYYYSMDLFLSPSREEGFCYSIIEAAYCETLCIATDISGQRKSDMKDIIWCEVEMTSLYKKINQIFDMSIDERKQKKQRLKQQALNGYNINKWVDTLIRIYNEWELI